VFKYLLSNAPTADEWTFTTNYQAALNHAVANDEDTPTVAIRLIENKALRTATASGLLAAVPRFYNFYTKHDSLFWKGIDFKNPGDGTQVDWTDVASIVDGGVSFNGVSSFGDPNFIPSTHHASIITATDCGYAVKTQATSETVGRCPYGNWVGVSGPAANHLLPGSGTNLTARLNSFNTAGQIS